MLSTEAKMARRMLELEVGLAYASYAESLHVLRFAEERVQAVERVLEAMNVSGTASTAGGSGGMSGDRGGSRLLTDLASMRVELAMARAEREDMAAMRDEARGMLASLLRRSPEELGDAAFPARLQDADVTTPHIERFIERAVATRPELELAELEAARTVALDALNNALDLPMLGVGGGVMWMPRHSHTSAMIEVSVSLPISRGARDARRTEHSLRRDLSRATEDATNEQIAREIAELGLSAARQRVRVHGLRETVLPSAEAAVATAEGEGELDLDPSRALQARLRVVDVRMSLARAEGELFRGLVRLENAVGEPLEILGELQ